MPTAYGPSNPRPGTALPPAQKALPSQTLNPVETNAYHRMQQLLAQFGLSSLGERVLAYVRDGLNEDSMLVELQNTKEWKQRFIANETRKNKGIPVLTPQEYLATERSYRQILTEAGVPTGFYDQTTDFQRFLENDMSPAELKGRVDTAATFVRTARPEQLAYMRQYYSQGDLVAFALDPVRAQPLVGRQFSAAQIGGNAAAQGLGLSRGLAEQLADTGLTDAQSRQALGEVGYEADTIDRLGAISGQYQLSDDEKVAAAVLGDQAAVTKSNRLRSQERARFGGTSGLGQGSLRETTSGL